MGSILAFEVEVEADPTGRTADLKAVWLKILIGFLGF